MDTIYFFFYILLILNFGSSVGFGVNLKKWYGWAQVFLGFVSGFIGAKKLVDGIVPGVLLALLLIWLGPIVWKRRQL